VIFQFFIAYSCLTATVQKESCSKKLAQKIKIKFARNSEKKFSREKNLGPKKSWSEKKLVPENGEKTFS